MLEQGDIIGIPAGIFRGFENIGADYAIINDDPRRPRCRRWGDLGAAGDGEADYPGLSPSRVFSWGVRRCWDVVAMAEDATVIGAGGMIRDRPAFEVSPVTRTSASATPHSHDRPCVLMPVRDHWRIDRDRGSDVLVPGETMSVPAGLSHSALPSMEGEAGLYHIVAIDDPAGPSHLD